MQQLSPWYTTAPPKTTEDLNTGVIFRRSVEAIRPGVWQRLDWCFSQVPSLLCMYSKPRYTCTMKPDVAFLPLPVKMTNLTKALLGTLLHRGQATCAMQGIMKQHHSVCGSVRQSLPEKTMDLAGLKPGSISTGCLARCQVSPTLADLVVFMPVMR